MKKINYLKYSLEKGLPKERDWFRRIFCVVRDKDEESFLKSEYMYDGRLFNDTFKIVSFMNNEKIHIEDAVIDAPLFTFSDIITVDESWNINLFETTETTVGRLIYNYLRIFLPFNNKIPYINKEIKISNLEDTIAAIMIDNPPDGQEKDPNEKRIYVDEYLYFLRTSRYLRCMSDIITVASTKKSITPPTGIKEFKQALLLKYKDQLSDPVKLAQYEKELLAFDDAYLKGDPSYGTSVSGKVKNVARKKMYLGVGYERGFSQDISVKPVINSLTEGWSKEPEQFVNGINAARVGSFDRGMGTVDGGVAASLLVRATDNFKVQKVDCGTNLGINRIYNDKNIKRLIGRYVIEDNNTVFIETENQARNYIGKYIRVRSPAYCKLTSDTICCVCAGEKLSRFENGMSSAATEVSSIILYIRMAAMHGVSLNTTLLKIEEHFT